MNCKNIPFELRDGLIQYLHHSNIDNMEISARRGEENQVSIKENVCEITYAEKVYFFRALSLIKEKTNGFSICENKKIKNVGVQLDLSRNAALKVSSVKNFMDYMAAMGMNKLYLYMEDMFEIPDRKFFGYLRGRYSEDELREIDNYGFNYGIEVIPSIQALGHHEQYLKWDEANDIKDTDRELLADNEATYEFIESMIKSVLKPLRTNKILLGMDETHNLGLGNFIRKNGYEEPRKIFLRHLKKVFEIVDGINAEGLIYSDMFFKVLSDKNYYYDESAEVSKENSKLIPENATLVYWHYGEEYGCDDFMLEKHKKLDRKTIFFGGSWTWMGHLPDTAYALECTKIALDSCVKHGIDEAIITIWGDNGNECNHFYSLLTAQYAAEYVYGNEMDFEKRFEDVTNGRADAFVDMSAYQDRSDENTGHKTFDMKRFKGKPLFWQDIMIGLEDWMLEEVSMSGHYKFYAEKFRAYSQGESPWKAHYEYIYTVLKVLEIKCRVAENIRRAYMNDDRQMLSELSDSLMNELYVFADRCHKMHKEFWFETYKPFGWEVLDIRYAGLKARIVTAVERIEKYLQGEITVIEELEEVILPYEYSPFTPYRSIATSSYGF